MPPPTFTQKIQRASRRDLAGAIAVTTLLTVGGFFLAFRFVQPAPPKKIVLAVGSDEGGAKYFAKRYQEFLQRNGITLELRPSSGAAENLRLLSDPNSGVDIAFVLGSTVPSEPDGSVVSLGSLSYAPLWVFYRGDTIDDVASLKGKRIAVGPLESGTYALAHALLAINKADKSTELLPFERQEGMDRLASGQIDTLFIISPAESPAIQKFATMPNIHLMSFARADAYVKRFTHLTKLTVPRGIFDLAADIPEHDVTVLSPTVNLLAKPSLHPALAYLLMRAATEIHGKAGLLDDAEDFPAPKDSGFPLSDQATRYYKSGSPFLQRYLPFWAANLVDRMWVMLVPIIALLIPLIRTLPPLYRWRIHSRIYRWYGRLKEVELELDDNPGRLALEGMLKRLDDIDALVNEVPTPLSYSENLYAFRQNVDLVRRRVRQRLAESATSPGATRAVG